MRRRIACVIYVVALLCTLFGPVEWARAVGVVTDGRHAGETVSPDDGRLHRMAEERQRPCPAVFSASQSSQRVGSTRTLRVVPSHGSNPGRSMGRWTGNDTFHLLKYGFLFTSCGHGWLRAWTAPPRFYYVIALRRILC